MTARRLSIIAALALAALVLGGAAWLRGAEYDEQYTVFLLAGDARPVWPDGVFTAGQVRDRFHGTAGMARVAADLRRLDVHPPLYFWAVSAWRRIAGATLFRLRLFSVLCGLGALATIGAMARRIGVPAVLAILLTLGCYGFAYTSSVARGFALAQLLALLGTWAALRPARHERRQALAVGLLMGAASFANYLAAFGAVPVLAWLAARRWRAGAVAVGGFAVFVAADLVFFVAQRGSRPGQFPPFHLLDGLARLAQYGAASVAGGLPLYVPPPLVAPVAAVSVTGMAVLALLVAARWPRIATPSVRWLLLGGIAATPLGLLALGLVFNTTPIELRYLAFSVPYAALLLAGALGSLERPVAAWCGGVVLAVQAAAVAGLLLRPETMQPMRDTAREAAALADANTVVMLPRGNDGVGVVGAFIAEAPDRLRILLVDPATSPAALRGIAPRLLLARLGRDRDSRAAVAALTAGLGADPCWRAVPGGFNVSVFETICEDAPWASSTASR